MRVNEDLYEASVDERLLYERVASFIEELVAHGPLRPGDRCPSVRKLARQGGVSIATVLAAYVHLEDRGVIEAHIEGTVRPTGCKVLIELDEADAFYEGTNLLMPQEYRDVAEKDSSDVFSEYG